MAVKLAYSKYGERMSALAEVQEKLTDLGGGPHAPLKVKLRLIKPALRKIDANRWGEEKVNGRIKRFLKSEQTPKAEEVDDIRAAHAQHSAKQLFELNRRADAKLIENIRQFIQMAENSDTEFYRAQLEALGSYIDDLVNGYRPAGHED